MAFMFRGRNNYAAFFLALPAGTASFLFAEGSLNPAMGGVFFVAALASAVRYLFLSALGEHKYLWVELTGIVLTAAGTLLAVVLYPSTFWTFILGGLVFLPLLMAFYVPFNLWRNEIKVLRSQAKALPAGAQVPDFALLNESGNLVRLSDFRDIAPVLLVFYRGDWCPYCNIMLRTYKKHADRFLAKGVVLLAISPDGEDTNHNLVQGLRLPFHILADKSLEITKQYGLEVGGFTGMSTNDYQTDGVLPASFLIDKSGKLIYASTSEAPSGILSPDRIFPLLDRV